MIIKYLVIRQFLLIGWATHLQYSLKPVQPKFKVPNPCPTVRIIDLSGHTLSAVNKNIL